MNQPNFQANLNLLLHKLRSVLKDYNFKRHIVMEFIQ